MAKYAKSKKPLVLGLRLSRLSVKKYNFLCFHWTSQTRSRGQDDGSIGYRCKPRYKNSKEIVLIIMKIMSTMIIIIISIITVMT